VIRVPATPKTHPLFCEIGINQGKALTIALTAAPPAISETTMGRTQQISVPADPNKVSVLTIFSFMYILLSWV